MLFGPVRAFQRRVERPQTPASAAYLRRGGGMVIRCNWASGYRRTARTPSVRRRGVWPACDPLSARCPTTSRRSVPLKWQKSLLPPPHRKTFRVRASAAAACACRWPLGTRLVIKRVEKELGQKQSRRFGLLECQATSVCEEQEARPGVGRDVCCARS